MFIVCEIDNFFNLSGTTRKTVKDCMESCTWLHGDDAKLIFFINPDKESLGLVVEDTTTVWPVTIEVASFEETISFLEKEVISNKLFALFLSKSIERVELASKVASV